VNLLIDCKGVKLLPFSFLHLSVQAEAPTAAMDGGDAVIEGAAARISHVLCEGSRPARGCRDRPDGYVGLVEREDIRPGECVALTKKQNRMKHAWLFKTASKDWNKVCMINISGCWLNEYAAYIHKVV
jgi:hypothetical protein